MRDLEKRRVRRLLFYLLYVGFVMALTTSAVMADMASRSFFIKRRCYVEEGGELTAVEPPCKCPCSPSDRLWDCMWCKRCKHYVSADAYTVVPSKSSKRASTVIPSSRKIKLSRD